MVRILLTISLNVTLIVSLHEILRKVNRFVCTLPLLIIAHIACHILHIILANYNYQYGYYIVYLKNKDSYGDCASL